MNERVVDRLDPRSRALAHEVTVLGIPALATITRYDPGKDAMMPTPNSPGEPPEGAEIEWDLWDVHGYRADWLFDRMSNADLEQLDDHLMTVAEADRGRGMEP